ncbi:MAG: glycosyltransferase family 4 protein [Bacteroidetes bacterium]|nr:glycosyltransferase family 4 protein [Bacteroidota bacterium]
MEIIHLILGKANPQRMNGVNKVVYQLATHQKRQGRNVSIWGITADLSRNFDERIFETLLFPASKNPFGVSLPLRTAIKGLAGKDVVFHLHGGWVPVYATISKLFQRHGIRFVITGHGAYNTVAMNRSKWIKKAYFTLFEKPLLRRASQVHSIGLSEVQGLQKIYPNQKSMLLPYGFEFQQTGLQYKPNPEGFTIGFVGRLDTWTKGLDLLISAFDVFQKQNNDSKLWIIGDGTGRADLEKYIADNGVSNVVLWGSKFGDEKDNLIAQMHVFVHPSRNEGLPASVLEAAAIGVPVIVSQPTNVAETVALYKAGTALATNTAEALAEAFVHLKRNDEQTMKALSANARKMVLEVYTWDKLIAKFDPLYST